MYNNKQLLDEVFVITRIIKVKVLLRLITLTETLIILDITKLETYCPFYSCVLSDLTFE